MKLILKLPSSVNHIYGRNKFGSVYLKKEGKQYKKEMIKLIQEEVKNQQWVKVENEFLYMDEIVIMNRVGRDADNLKKLTQDSITESQVVWSDDTYCLARTQRIYIDSKNPRIELTISKAEHKGIYNNIEEYNNFINTYCNNCYKNKNKCTLLRESLESRINENLAYDDGYFKCLKFKKGKRVY